MPQFSRLLTFLFLCGPLNAGDINRSVETYINSHGGAPALVENFLNAFLTSNKPEGLFFKGLAALEGYGQRPHINQANTYFYEAAALGYGPAQKALADSYIAGHGFSRNAALARIYYERAAQGGYGPAQLNVAMMYARGEGGAASLTKACFWLRKANQNKAFVLREEAGELSHQLGCLLNTKSCF
jgi:TPR repeat protein